MIVGSKPIRFSPIGKFIACAILIVLAIWLFRALGPVLSPFIGAAITAYLFNPLIRLLHSRTRVGRAIWILALYALIGVLMYMLLRFVGPLIAAQYNEIVAQFPGMVRDFQFELAAIQVVEFGGLRFDIGPIEAPILDFLTEIGRNLPERVPHLFLTAIESVLLFLTYLIVTFYFLLQYDQLVNWLYNLVPAPYRAEIRGLGDQVDNVLSGYVRGTLLLIPIMAVLTYILLTVLGVRYALVIAIATGFLEVIPLIGPWSAALIAMSVSLLQPVAPFGWDNWVLAAVVGVSYFVLRMSEDNFIIPYVVGHAVHLHPVLVLFAILAGGALGGAFGLFISIPTVAIIRLLLRYIYRKLVDSPEQLPPPDLQTPPKLAVTARAPDTAQPLAGTQTIEPKGS